LEYNNSHMDKQLEELRHNTHLDNKINFNLINLANNQVLLIKTLEFLRR